MRLNSLFPRRLWAMTVEGLLPTEIHGRSRRALSEDDIILDPLYVLRCDEEVYRWERDKDPLDMLLYHNDKCLQICINQILWFHPGWLKLKLNLGLSFFDIRKKGGSVGRELNYVLYLWQSCWAGNAVSNVLFPFLLSLSYLSLVFPLLFSSSTTGKGTTSHQEEKGRAEDVFY